MAEAKTETSKKLRRGISNSTQAVTQLKFHEKDAANNGLFVAHLESVEVNWSTNEAGVSTPRLSLHFASEHPTANEQRHYHHSFFPVESNVDTIPGGKDEWRVNALLSWIKHVLDIYYLKGRELTEAEEDALALPFCDFDENGFVSVEPQEVLNGYGAVFTSAAAMLNGTYADNGKEASGKPVYKTTDGKFIKAWLKLLRHTKVKNEWRNVDKNGELAFDTFPRSGAIELVRPNVAPTLRLDLAKESITPKEVNKKPTIGTAGIPGMGGVAVPGMPDMGTPYVGDASAAAAAGEGMPF